MRRQSLGGRYRKPFVVECGRLRFLHFDRANIQSVMRDDEPDELCLAYTRKMMSFLLFQPRPRRLLLLGLGGGSLAKFCYRHLPATAITVVEIDPNILALRDQFRIPRDDERLHVLQGDGVQYVRTPTPREDVILVDACDRSGMASALEAPQVYGDLRRRLTRGGVLVVNACGAAKKVASHIGRIRGVFGEHIITLPVIDDGNLIVLAFRTAAALRSEARLEARARDLEKRLGLPYAEYLNGMQRSAAGAITTRTGPLRPNPRT